MGVTAVSVYKYFPEQAYLLIFAAIIIISLLGFIQQYQKRQSDLLLKKKAKLNPSNDNEYHNDFSKVPAGTTDQFQPRPLSIGGGHGDGGRTLDEDLERIGIEIKGNDKYKKY